MIRPAHLGDTIPCPPRSHVVPAYLTPRQDEERAARIMEALRRIAEAHGLDLDDPRIQGFIGNVAQIALLDAWDDGDFEDEEE